MDVTEIHKVIQIQMQNQCVFEKEKRKKSCFKSYKTVGEKMKYLLASSIL